MVDSDFLIGIGRARPTLALQHPAGNRLIVTSTDFAAIIGNHVDLTGPGPIVGEDFIINTTPGVANENAQLAADPTSGKFTVVWESFEDLPGDFFNIRGRRFDSRGNPIGDDFIVNDSTAGTQWQPAVAMLPGGTTAIVWASEDPSEGNILDIYLRVFDPDGNPIGGEIVSTPKPKGCRTSPPLDSSPSVTEKAVRNSS